MAGFYDFGARLEQLRRDNLLRRVVSHDGPQGPLLEVDGRRLVNFCSNDYLGLAAHPDLAAALAAGAAAYGVGGGAAHLLSGHARPHRLLEEELAAFTGREKALLFSTGYMANLGVISALVGPGDVVLQDRLNHASLLDGALLARARLSRFRHADLADLEARLQAHEGRCLIVSDAVFSMDGDIADAPGLAALAARHGAGLLLDDAHGFGVLGAHGGGAVEHFGLSQAQAPLLMATLGKACGGFGAFVAGSAELIEWLVQSARTYIYTTAMPPAVAEANRAALRIVRHEAWRREKLAGLITRFRAGAERLGLAISQSSTPIQPLLLGDSGRVLQAGQGLRERGFWVGAIRPPTVPAGTARLRISLSAAHEESQVDALLQALHEVLA